MSYIRALLVLETSPLLGIKDCQTQVEGMHICNMLQLMAIQ